MEGPVVAEAVEGFGVEGGGDEVLMARDGGGDGETFEVDDGGVAAVGDACAIERWRTKADQICKSE